MFQRLFLNHPRQVGESYFQHQRVALFVAVKLLQAGLAAFLHSIVPCLFERTARNMIRELHTRLERR
jgi:hypothetical protein